MFSFWVVVVVVLVLDIYKEVEIVIGNKDKVEIADIEKVIVNTIFIILVTWKKVITIIYSLSLYSYLK